MSLREVNRVLEFIIGFLFIVTVIGSLALFLSLLFGALPGVDPQPALAPF